MGEVCSRDGEGEVGTGEGGTEARERVLGEGAGRSRSAGCVLGGRLACLGLSRVREAGVLGNATKHTSRLDRHRRMHEHARRDQGCQRQASVSVQIRRWIPAYPWVLGGGLGSTGLQTAVPRFS